MNLFIIFLFANRAKRTTLVLSISLPWNDIVSQSTNLLRLATYLLLWFLNVTARVISVLALF